MESSNGFSNHAHELFVEIESKKKRKQKQHQGVHVKKLSNLEFKAKFGKNPRIRVPDECALEFFDLAKKLGHKSDGDTIAWLLKQAAPAVQTVVDEIDEDCSNQESNKKRKQELEATERVLSNREFYVKFGKIRNLRVPDECAFNFFELTKMLGFEDDGDTITWLLKQVKPSVQADMGEENKGHSNYGHELLFAPHEEQQTKEKPEKKNFDRKRGLLKRLSKREFKAKFGRGPRVRLPEECAFDYFKLTDNLGYKRHGDTITWLLNQAEPAVQTLIGKQDENDEVDEKKTKVEQSRPMTTKDLGQFGGEYQLNQVWALWDNEVDGMPRVYAQIQKLLLTELKAEVALLKPMPYTIEEKQWLSEKKLPMACGKFKLAKSTSTIEIADFSHPVNVRGGVFKKWMKIFTNIKMTSWANIFPRDGEIWAVFKDWNANWTLHDLSRARYELVEVVSELPNEDSDMTVIFLTRVGKTGAVFERGYHKGAIKWRQYTGKQLLHFSHQIPASKLKVEEMEGVPNEAWKLNPAAVPIHLM